MVRKLQNLLIFLLLAMGVEGNNIRSGSTVEIVEVVGDTAVLQFDLQWDNSWRDDYNWDAAWVFLKYKETGGDWQPVYLGEGGHAFTGDYTYMTGKSGANVTGLYVFRSRNSAGATSTTCRLKWKLPAGMTQEKFKKNQAFIMAQGVEMVLIPYGAYYLGDIVSKNSFQSIQQRIIPAADDVIGTNSAYSYSASSTYSLGPGPGIVADRVNNSLNNHITNWQSGTASGDQRAWWMVDFGEAKTIRSFGVSGSSDYPTCKPSGTWYLEAINTLIGDNWIKLWEGGPENWVTDVNSYPVRHAININNNSSFRYYRIRMEYSAYPLHPAYIICNVAMSEKDLYPSDAYLTDSEDKIAFGKGFNQLYANDGATWTGEMATVYPKGYKGFYVMKYELSQEQYVAFLNTLTFVQQAERVPGLATMKQGEYVFGERTKPSNRNGIIVNVPSTGSVPVIFANNLNNDGKYNQADDGKTIACNYMTPEDMYTYSSWAGLRPMSELEYEKASRTPYPETPKAGEYAWNDNAVPVKASTVNNGGMGSERPTSGNVNAGNTFGPIRSGSFAKVGSSQVQAGATYWGVMEMSGNLKELCITATGTLDGSVSGSGAYSKAVTGWTVTPAHYGLRGGGFSSVDEQLRTSDRSTMTVSAVRDSTVGFRGVGVLSGSALNGGTLTAPATNCAGTPLTITGTPISSAAPVAYQWYVKAPGGAYEMIMGATAVDLTYQLVNTTSAVINYTFRRKAFSAIGEGWSNELSVAVTNASINLTPTSIVIDDCGNTIPVKATIAMSGITPVYTWSYNGSALPPGVQNDTYTPSLVHFGGASGDLKVTCTAMINGCSGKSELTVSVPALPAPIAATAVTMENCGSVFFYDDRDVESGGTRKIYCTVKLGTQCWMGANLNVGKFTEINASDYWMFDEVGIQKWCIGCATENCIINNASQCDLTGGLYEWWEMICGGQCNSSVSPGNAQNMDLGSENQLSAYGAIMTPDGTKVQGICPAGWHIPTDAEWGTLGSNQTGWSAKLGGIRDLNGRGFYYLGGRSYWWSSTPNSSSRAYGRYLSGMSVGTVLIQSVNWRSGGLSVRCLQN